jgi:hypothetical protein
MLNNKKKCLTQFKAYIYTFHRHMDMTGRRRGNRQRAGNHNLMRVKMKKCNIVHIATPYMGNTAQVGNTIYAQIEMVSVKVTWLTTEPINRLVVDKGRINKKGQFMIDRVEDLQTIRVDVANWISNYSFYNDFVINGTSVPPNNTLLQALHASRKVGVKNMEVWVDNGLHLYGTAKDSDGQMFTIHYIVK